MFAPDCKVGDRVSRPWGFYEILAVGETFKVKRLTLEPGKSTSRQFHRHRTEYIFTTDGALMYTVLPNIWHQIFNRESTVLELIELQFGECLEADIVRQEIYDKDKGRIA